MQHKPINPDFQPGKHLAKDSGQSPGIILESGDALRKSPDRWICSAVCKGRKFSALTVFPFGFQHAPDRNGKPGGHAAGVAEDLKWIAGKGA